MRQPRDSPSCLNNEGFSLPGMKLGAASVWGSFVYCERGTSRVEALRFLGNCQRDAACPCTSINLKSRLGASNARAASLRTWEQRTPQLPHRGETRLSRLISDGEDSTLFQRRR